MKLHYLLISSLIATTSVALFASRTDSKIEDAAKASYTTAPFFRTR